MNEEITLHAWPFPIDSTVPYGCNPVHESLFIYHYTPEERFKMGLHNHELDVVLLVGGAGSSKCWKIGTKFVLYNGDLKKVEDLKVGDLLMGPDSKPRKILSLGSGREIMYKVTPIKGDPFYCNESHILSLKLTNQGTDTRIKASGDVYIKPPRYGGVKIVNVSIKEYLTWSPRKKKAYKLYRSEEITFPKNKEKLPIDPYTLGLWLGDGNSANFRITNIDPEIIDYLVEQEGCYATADSREGRGHIYSIGNCKKNSLLKSLNLTNNKHVPKIYKTGSVETRLKLLAGVIDTDGSVGSNHIIITQKNKQIIDDLAFIARSLGFAAYTTPFKGSCPTKNGLFIGDYWRINISGNLESIPTLIPRKKLYERKQIKSVLTTGFSLEKLPEDDYYGFQLDGDCLHLLEDFTIVHNTTSCIAEVVELVAAFPGCKAVIGGKHYTLLQRNVVDPFGQRFSKSNLQGDEWSHPIVKRWFKNDWIMKTIHGSQIQFLNLDKYEVARGFDADVVLIEEVNLMDANSFDEMIRRSRGKTLPIRQFLLTMNPTGDRDWIFDKFLMRQFEPGYMGDPIPIGTPCTCQYCQICLNALKQEWPWEGGEKTPWSWTGAECSNPDCAGMTHFKGGLRATKRNNCPGNQYFYRVIRSKSWENLHVPASYVQDMKASMDEESYRLYVEGEIIQLRKGKVYTAFTSNNVLGVDIHLDPKKDIYWTLDFNIKPQCSVIVQERGDIGLPIHVVDEIVLWDATEEQVAKKFCEKFRGFENTVFIYGDPAGLYGATLKDGRRTSYAIIADYLKSQGFKVEIKMKKVKGQTRIPINDRVNNLNAACKNSMDEIKIKVNPSCQHLIQSLASVNWDEKGEVEDSVCDENARNNPHKEKFAPIMTHPACALGYLITKRWPIIKQFSGVKLLETEDKSITRIDNVTTITDKKPREAEKKVDENNLKSFLKNNFGFGLNSLILKERLEYERLEKEKAEQDLLEKINNQ